VLALYPVFQAAWRIASQRVAIAFETYWMKSSSPLLEALIGGDCWTALELPPLRRAMPPNIVPRTPMASYHTREVSPYSNSSMLLYAPMPAQCAVPSPVPRFRAERSCCP
jgi:hypothetical protein